MFTCDGIMISRKYLIKFKHSSISQRFSDACQDLRLGSAIERRTAGIVISETIKSEFCLKSRIANYRAEKPIIKSFMTDIQYDMDNLMQTAKPTELETVTVENRGGIPQTISREISYTTTKAESHSKTRGTVTDVAVEVLIAPKGSPKAAGVAGETTQGKGCEFHYRAALRYLCNGISL